MRRLPRPLDAVELRVLGSLIEKSRTTPDLYPLTPNAIVAACNQRTAREPVTDFTGQEVAGAPSRLRDLVLAWRRDGARSERWTENLTEKLVLSSGEVAALCLLILRGPQTPGEIRSRADRLHSFASVGEAEEALARLAGGPDPLATELPRRPGQKESRWAHLLGDEPVEVEAPRPSAASAAAPSESRPAPADDARLDRLEAELAELRAELAELKRSLGA